VSSAGAATLSEAANLPIGSQVTIEQAVVINATPLSLTGQNLIQLRDDGRAVTIFTDNDVLDLDTFLNGAQNGDVISFSATTTNYHGLFELTAPAQPATVINPSGISTGLSAIPVTPADFDDFSPTAESLESRYVALQDIELFYGGLFINQDATPGRPVAGELFEPHTTYIAVDAEGNESIVWARSQASVDLLNQHFGTVPQGPFDLPGILLQAFDGGDPTPGVAGVNYLLNPIIVHLPGDLDGDGYVGLSDLDIILLHWNTATSPGDLATGDISGDGFVGLDDLDQVLVNWNGGTPPTEGRNTHIPEPSGMLCLGLMLTGAVLRRRPTLSRPAGPSLCQPGLL